MRVPLLLSHCRDLLPTRDPLLSDRCSPKSRLRRMSRRLPMGCSAWFLLSPSSRFLLFLLRVPLASPSPPISIVFVNGVAILSIGGGYWFFLCIGVFNWGLRQDFLIRVGCGRVPRPACKAQSFPTCFCCFAVAPSSSRESYRSLTPYREGAYPFAEQLPFSEITVITVSFSMEKSSIARFELLT